jgi:hypothetical protein
MDEKLLRKEIRKILFEMSGFARVKNTMMGAVNSINSVGIVTAENPMAQELSSEENNKLNNQIKQYLKDLSLGYQQIKGKYGNLEHPFLIQNISKENIINLGRKYNQESIVYGEKQEYKDRVYFKWEIITLFPTPNVEETTYSNISGTEVDKEDDFYSIIKGRKFKLPFYDENPPMDAQIKRYSTPKN